MGSKISHCFKGSSFHPFSFFFFFFHFREREKEDTKVVAVLACITVGAVL